MSLDLCNYMNEWPDSNGEVVARIVHGQQGEELLQMRIDLGILQFLPEGRPDGERVHGMRTACEFAQRELRLGSALAPQDWAELRREYQQFNCRRLAYTGLAERALADSREIEGKRYLRGAVSDCEFCVEILKLIEQHDPDGISVVGMQLPNLLFNRARLSARLLAMDHQFDEAIDAAESGARELEELFLRSGEDEAEENPGIAYLTQLGKRLREQSGHSRTLHEQLEDAIEREDFEAAARLRDEISRHRSTHSDSLPSPENSDETQP